MLARNHRFHGLGSLKFAYSRGETVRAPLLSLRFARNPRRNTFRVAVVVSRKVNKSAVVRNRIRRRVYEAFQNNAQAVSGPYDLVFTVFSEQAASVQFEVLEKQVKQLLKKLETSGHDIVNTEGKQV